MKKLLLIVIIILSLATAATAADNWPFIKNTPPFTTLQTLSTGTTTTGTTTATAVEFGMPYSTITCMTTQGTGTATNIAYLLQGSLDGTSYITLKTVTSTAWPDIQTTNAATAVPVFYMKATLNVLTGGSAAQPPIFKCFGSR